MVQFYSKLQLIIKVKHPRMRNKKITHKQEQLTNKLNSIRSSEELKKIYHSVYDQNILLKNDIGILKNKVEECLQKQKSKNVPVINKAEQEKITQLAVHQKQLKEQYKIMQELKKRRQTAISAQATQQLNEQLSKLLNQISNLEEQLKQARVTVNDLKNQSIFLEQSIKTHEEQNKRNEPKINEFAVQNYGLRKKIMSLKKLSSEHESESAKVFNTIYSKKSIISKNDTISQQLKRKLSTSNPTETININQLQQEVSQLKLQVQKVQQEQLKQQNILIIKKNELINLNKESTKTQKQLEHKRNKAQQQLNRYKKIWQKYIEYQNNLQSQKQYIPQNLQIDQYQDNNPLRRDFAGIFSNKFNFDDRFALQDNKKSFIVGFHIYQQQNLANGKNSLIGIRAIYNDIEANARNHPPLPGVYLNKCKSSTYMLPEGDFLKLMKIKSNSLQNRIIKIQIRTNKNSKYQFGDKRSFNEVTQAQNVYGFDISIGEYPVSLFGSYGFARSQWYMQSLGVEINDL